MSGTLGKAANEYKSTETTRVTNWADPIYNQAILYGDRLVLTISGSVLMGIG